MPSLQPVGRHGERHGDGGLTPHFEIGNPLANAPFLAPKPHTGLASIGMPANTNQQSRSILSTLASFEQGVATSPRSKKPQLSPLIMSEEPESLDEHAHRPGSGFKETALRASSGTRETGLESFTDRGASPFQAPGRIGSADFSSLRSRAGSPITSPITAGAHATLPSRHNSDGALLDQTTRPSPQAVDRVQEEDDEFYKGHSPVTATFGQVAYIDDDGMPRRRDSLGPNLWSAVKRAVSPIASPGAQAHHPLHHHAGRGVSEDDGRKTPARYRPASSLADRKGKGKMSLQLDSSAAAARRSLGGGSRREAWAFAGTPSPAHLLHHLGFSDAGARSSTSSGGGSVRRPEARRGAIRLSKRGRLRAVHAPLASEDRGSSHPLASLFWGLLHVIRTLLWSIVRPHLAVRLAAQNVRHSAHAMDAAFRDPRTNKRVWKPEWLDAYIPLIIWLGISLASSALVIAFHQHVFTFLDHLASTLRSWGLSGKFALGALIFLTTFPPLPLYSTLIILGGFTFGLWQGFIIAYGSALLGAIAVFTLSRTLLRSKMERLFQKSGGLKKVIRAIEKQPRLLFLIRLAPYPYNLMNTLLASSSTLTLKTYTICTALALPKLLVHCGIGTSIKDFADYKAGGNGASGDAQDDGQAATAERAKSIFGIVGIVLCIGIFLHLLSVARRAVDQLDDEDAAYEELDVTDSAESGSDFDEVDEHTEGERHQRGHSLHSVSIEAASPWRGGSGSFETATSDMQEVHGPGKATMDKPLLLQIEDMEASAEDYDFGKHLGHASKRSEASIDQ